MLSVFEEFRVSVESVPTTVDTTSVIVQSEHVSECIYEIVARLREVIRPDDIRIDEHLALIAIVGRAMKHSPGISGRLLSEFGRNQINIRAINQSGDEMSIIVGVDNRDFEKAVRAIYTKFIAEVKQK